MNGWNWVEIDSLVTAMARIYKRKGHKVPRGDFERVPIRKGASVYGQMPRLRTYIEV